MININNKIDNELSRLFFIQLSGQINFKYSKQFFDKHYWSINYKIQSQLRTQIANLKRDHD